jgi:hypothetical protein
MPLFPHDLAKDPVPLIDHIHRNSLTRKEDNRSDNMYVILL